MNANSKDIAIYKLDWIVSCLHNYSYVNDYDVSKYKDKAIGLAYDFAVNRAYREFAIIIHSVNGQMVRFWGNLDFEYNPIFGSIKFQYIDRNKEDQWHDLELNEYLIEFFHDYACMFDFKSQAEAQS